MEFVTLTLKIMLCQTDRFTLVQQFDQWKILR